MYIYRERYIRIYMCIYIYIYIYIYTWMYTFVTKIYISQSGMMRCGTMP